MLDRGHGQPVVTIPGIQGRWEWMLPAVNALATRCRVITESLPGDRGSSAMLDPSVGFEVFNDWMDGLFDRAGIDHAALCGVSYGGLVALHYAAANPGRVTSLVLVSTPSPTWKPDCRVELYLRAPRLMSPVFALSSPFRLYPEIARAFPELGDRTGFALEHLYRVTRHPFAPSKMAARVRLLDGVDFAKDCARVSAPTLVVTGTPGLDRVVDTKSTREYLARIPGSTHAEIGDTGHIGLVTRPERFADLVGRFTSQHAAAPPAAMGVFA